MTEKKTTDGFEEKLKELENIVKTLENGDVSLDDMLTLFERGIKLTKSCSETLNNAEQKITMLIKGMNGEMDEQPFGTAE